MKNILEVLKTALEMEEQGKIYYNKAANEVKSPLVATVLESLASDEDAHIRVIKQYYNAFEHNKIFTTSDIENQTKYSADQRVQKIVSECIGEIEIDSNYASIYEKASNLERKGRDYYLKSAEESDDPEVKKFLVFLANVENIHLEILELVAKRFKK